MVNVVGTEPERCFNLKKRRDKACRPKRFVDKVCGDVKKDLINLSYEYLKPNICVEGRYSLSKYRLSKFLVPYYYNKPCLPTWEFHNKRMEFDKMGPNEFYLVNNSVDAEKSVWCDTLTSELFRSFLEFPELMRLAEENPQFLCPKKDEAFTATELLRVAQFNLSTNDDMKNYVEHDFNDKCSRHMALSRILGGNKGNFLFTDAFKLCDCHQLTPHEYIAVLTRLYQAMRAMVLELSSKEYVEHPCGDNYPCCEEPEIYGVPEECPRDPCGPPCICPCEPYPCVTLHVGEWGECSGVRPRILLVLLYLAATLAKVNRIVFHRPSGSDDGASVILQGIASNFLNQDFRLIIQQMANAQMGQNIICRAQWFVVLPKNEDHTPNRHSSGVGITDTQQCVETQITPYPSPVSEVLESLKSCGVQNWRYNSICGECRNIDLKNMIDYAVTDGRKICEFFRVGIYYNYRFCNLDCCNLPPCPCPVEVPCCYGDYDNHHGHHGHGSHHE